MDFKIKQIEKFLRRYESKMFKISFYLEILLFLSLAMSLAINYSGIINSETDFNLFKFKNGIIISNAISCILFLVIKRTKNIYLKSFSFLAIVCIGYHQRRLVVLVILMFFIPFVI